MKISHIIFLTITLSLSLRSQTNEKSSTRLTFFPSGLHFPPLKASIQEPRVGAFKFLDASQMKVDVGNAIDVLGLDIPTSHIRITAGIDFMAYIFTTGAQGLRLQVDAVDGFYGGNLSFSKEYNSNQLQARMRILHHSAHFVDGHYNSSTGSWIDNHQPIPFTRDFGELTIAHSGSPDFGHVRYYGGISYATLVRPVDVQRFSYLSGIELSFDKLFGCLLDRATNVYFAYNVSFHGSPAYAASHQLQVGLKLGGWYEKGATFYIAYYNGQHMFGEYFNERMSTIGAGFTVDFF